MKKLGPLVQSYSLITDRALNTHPNRRHEANRELHARPFPNINLPTRIIHAAFAVEGAERRAFCDAIAAITPCGQAPTPDDVHFATDANGVTLRTEFHTEFASVTLIAPDDSNTIALPRHWLDNLPGEQLVMAECLCAYSEETAEAHAAKAPIGSISIVAGGRATLGTNFEIGTDGLTHLRLSFHGAPSVRQTGRIVQQVLEIETYRTLAAFGLPLARAIQKDLTHIAEALPDETGSAAENFDRLTAHADALDRLWRQSNYRFSASRAYYAIVRERLEELAEQAIPGRQTVGQFLRRRVAPALATCEATEKRRHDLAEQVSARANLLRTRIELELQQQNRDLLSAINQGAERRLQMEQAVEGLSVAAISYYVLGLLGYPISAAHHWLEAMGLEPDYVKAALIPVVVGVVWMAVHRVRRKMLPGTKSASEAE